MSEEAKGAVGMDEDQPAGAAGTGGGAAAEAGATSAGPVCGAGACVCVRAQFHGVCVCAVCSTEWPLPLGPGGVWFDVLASLCLWWCPAAVCTLSLSLRSCHDTTPHHRLPCPFQPYAPLGLAWPAPRFEIKKWNAVTMWSWDICADTCAICRNNLNEPSIEYQVRSR